MSDHIDLLCDNVVVLSGDLNQRISTTLSTMAAESIPIAKPEISGAHLNSL